MKQTLILLFFIICTVSTSFAQVQWNVSANVLLEAEEVAYFDPPDRFSGLGSAFLLRGAALFPWGNRFIGGPYLKFSPGVEIFRFDESPTLVELGLSIGPRFEIVEEIEVRALVDIGYRGFLSSSDIVSADALATNLNLEVIFFKENTISPKFNLGFLAQPAGGNEDVFFSFSPYWFIGGGIVVN
ncbi:MAG: hypothetical protein AAF363_16105 [Bacteroidota bacterium]